MKNFSINRFGQTFRWMLVTHLQTFLAFTVGCAAAVFLLEMILIAFSVTADGGNYVPFLYSNVSQFFVIFLLIYALVAISTLFSYYLKKPQREAFLMLPSTNLEKFLSVVIYVTVVWSLAGFLAFAVGDTLRMAVRALFFHNEWYSLVPKMLDLFGDMKPYYEHGGMFIIPTSYKVCAYIFLYSLFIWIHSTYILGGTLLRKYAFVVSSLVIILAIVLIAWLHFKFNLEVFYTETWIDGQSLDAMQKAKLLENGQLLAVSDESIQIIQKVGVLGYFMTVALPLLSIFNYWASFHIFKGFQLITNKWTNYEFFK